MKCDYCENISNYQLPCPQRVIHTCSKCLKKAMEIQAEEILNKEIIDQASCILC